MPGVLDRNLEALARVNSPLAQQIRHTPIPQGYTQVTGSDDSETFARVATAPDARRIDWLGGTSMPRASAAPMVSALDAISKGANGLGLTIGAGHAWAAFLQKLPLSQMLFLLEPDLANLRMALDICDLSHHFSSRRLVLLPPLGPSAADWLVAFLAHNSGFEPPTVIHPLPSLTGPQKNELLAIGESIIRCAVRARQEQAAAARDRILSLLKSSRDAKKNVRLAFLLTPRYPLERPIGAFVQETGAAPLFIDRHDAAGPLLRMERLSQQLTAPAACGASDSPILSDLFREQLSGTSPDIPIETWVPPLVGPAFWERIPAASTLAPHDRIIVHSGYHARMLQTRGIPQQQIVFRPLHAPKKLSSAPIPAFALRHRVALLADLPTMDAEQLGIQLPTHQAVFFAARDLVAADPLAVHPGMAADLLRRALARAGVDSHTQDPALGEPMFRIVRDVLIPHLPLLCLAESLAAADIPLLLLGDWAGTEARLKVDGQRIVAVSFGDYSPAAWESVAVFAHLSPAGIVTPFLWEAVAAGIPIAAPEHPSDLQPDLQVGSIVTLLRPAVEFSHPPAAGFLSALKQLLRDVSGREKRAAAALLAAQAQAPMET